MNSSGIADLLDTLWLRGLRFRVEDGTLYIKPADKLTPGEVEQLREGKAEALALVLAADPPGPGFRRTPLCVSPACRRRGRRMLRTVRRRPCWTCPGCGAVCAEVGPGDWAPEEHQGDEEHRGPGTVEGDAAS